MAINYEQIKAVVSDADDTMYLSYKRFEKVADLFCETNKMDLLEREKLKATWGKPFKIVLSTLWPQIPLEIIDNFYRDKVEDIKKDENLIQSLNELMIKGYTVGVISSGGRNWINQNLEACIPGVNLHFLQTIDDHEHHKPDPRVFNPFFEKHPDLKPQNVLYIGDSISDWQAARDAELQFAAVLTGIKEKQDFIEAKLPEENIFPNLISVISTLS